MAVVIPTPGQAKSILALVATAGTTQTLVGPATYDVTMTTNCTFVLTGNQPVTLVCRQDTNGNHLAFFSSNVVTPASFAPLSTAAKHYDVLEFVPDALGYFTVFYVAQNCTQAVANAQTATVQGGGLTGPLAGGGNALNSTTAVVGTGLLGPVKAAGVAAGRLSGSGSGTLGQLKGGGLASGSASTTRFSIGVNSESIGSSASALPGVAGTNYPLPTQTEFNYYASKGMKVLRLSILWERVQPTLLGSLNSTYLGYMDNAVSQAGTAGLKTIIDVHNYGRYTNTSSGVTNTIGDGTLTNTHFADLWTKLATHYAGNSNVYAYDTMNEWHDMPNGSNTINSSANQAAVNAIRAVDQVTNILVEGNGYSSATGWPNENPGYPLTDPGTGSGKIWYSAHFYMDRNGSGTGGVWSDEVAAGDQVDGGALTTQVGVTRVTPFVNWCKSNSVLGHIGEMGIGNNNGTDTTDGGWWTAGDNALAYLQSNDIPITLWDAGPWSGGDVYTLEQQSNGTDQLNMSVVTKYTGVSQPTALYWTGSQGGTQGTAATLGVMYQGYLQNSFTVSIACSSGALSATQLTIPAGFNPTAYFTYTPSQSGNSTLTMMNGSGYTNATALNFSASGAAPQGTSAAYNLTMTSDTYAPAKFGNGLASGGGVSSASGSPVTTAVRAAACTWECWAQFTGASTGVFYLTLQEACFTCGVNNGRLYVTYSDVNGNYPYFDVGTVITDTLHHIEIDFNNVVTLYVDGVEVGSNPTQATANTGYGQFQVGFYQSNQGNDWVGLIDEMRVSNVVRHTANFTPPTQAYTGLESGTVVLYHFDGTGNGLN